MARLISLVEDGNPVVPDLMAALASTASRAYVVGLTGAPGVGKSTTTSALVTAYRARGVRVGVLAVDPSSPFSGGALLGDRIRMADHAGDPGVFIRSMAARGHLGGLSASAPQAVRVLEAAGCEIVLVETVGVGQSEVEVAALADTTVIVLAPGMGDGIQAAKAGILEIGDIFVVNKADRDGAGQTVHDLRHMVSLGARRGPGDWRERVISCSATTGQGIEDVLEALDAHRAWLGDDRLRERRVRRSRAEIEGLVLAAMRQRLAGTPGDPLNTLAEAVVAGQLSSYAAAERLRKALAEDPGDLASQRGVRHSG